MGVGQRRALYVMALLLLIFIYGVVSDNEFVQIPFWALVVVGGFTQAFVASHNSSAGVMQPRRQGRGPWLILLALLSAAIFVGALLWYYSPQIEHGSGSP